MGKHDAGQGKGPQPVLAFLGPLTSPACHCYGSFQKGLPISAPRVRVASAASRAQPWPPTLPCPSSLAELLPRFPERHSYPQVWPQPMPVLGGPVPSSLPPDTAPSTLSTTQPAHQGLCRVPGAALPCLWPTGRTLRSGTRDQGWRCQPHLAGPSCLGSPESRFQDPCMAGRSCSPILGHAWPFPTWPLLALLGLSLPSP